MYQGHRGENARAKAMDLLPIIDEIKAGGVISCNGIAKVLNDRNIPAPRGGKWQRTQVRRILQKVA